MFFLFLDIEPTDVPTSIESEILESSFLLSCSVEDEDQENISKG